MAEFTELLSMFWVQLLLIAVAGYLLGSINSSIIITNKSEHTDIRTLGSGNAGFTNVLRCVGKVPAVLTFIGDFLKAAVAVFLAWLIMSYATDNREYIALAKYIGGLFSVIGHMFPVYFSFKGGKGVVTSASMMLCCDYRFLIISGLIFLVVFLISRIISLSSLVASVSFPLTVLFINYFFGYKSGLYSITFVVATSIIAVIIASLVIIRHRENIIRLARGEEKKISAKK